MTVYLYITAGPLKGFKIRAKNGLTIGDSTSHVNLKDPSISGVQAKITLNNNNEFIIQNIEANPELSYNNSPFVEQYLTAEDKIKIGLSEFQVHIAQDNTKAKAQTSKNTDFGIELIKNKYGIISQKSDEKPISLTSMAPIVKLHFIKGLQLETEWHIGYGPRIIGSESLDLKIMEKNAPPICFELIPSEKGVLFQTDHKKIITINGKSKKQHTLKQDDIIKIFESEIKVSLIQ